MSVTAFHHTTSAGAAIYRSEGLCAGYPRISLMSPAGTCVGLVAGLPADGAHPLKELAFGPGSKLYMNVGSVNGARRDGQ